MMDDLDPHLVACEPEIFGTPATSAVPVTAAAIGSDTMTWQWLALAGLAVVALVIAVGLLVALARLRARTSREIGSARDEAAALRERLDRLEQERRTPIPPERAELREYRITGLGEPEADDGPPAQVERAVFADLLLRESVIRLGSLGHGVRRAMSAESRNRIRFEMKREVKRARKQRRAEQREAYRDWQARRRDELTDADLRDTA